jgi:hypothetical protein
MTTILIIRTIHILAGVVWAGFGIVVAGFLLPSLAPEGRRAVGQWMATRGQALVGSSALLTIFSGLYLIITLHKGDTSAMGMTLGIGGALAILAFIIGITVIGPATRRLGAMQQTPGALTPDQAAALQRRAVFGARLAASLIFLSVLAMASARYV